METTTNTTEQQFELSHNGEVKFTGGENDCYFKLQRLQGQSADWAMKYEGWKIEPVVAPVINSYEQQAIEFLNTTGATIAIAFKKHNFHFNGDKNKRDIYGVAIERKGRKYTFDFGNSIAHSGRFVLGYKNRFMFDKMPKWGEVPSGYHLNEVKTNPEFKVPTAYDVLACLTKYDVGEFDDFCSDFGYEWSNSKEYKQVEKTYNAVVKEYDNLQKLFTEDEMELLREIN